MELQKRGKWNTQDCNKIASAEGASGKEAPSQGTWEEARRVVMRSKHSILLIMGLLVAYAVLMDYNPFRRVEEGQWSRGAAKQVWNEVILPRKHGV